MTVDRELLANACDRVADALELRGVRYTDYSDVPPVSVGVEADHRRGCLWIARYAWHATVGDRPGIVPLDERDVRLDQVAAVVAAIAALDRDADGDEVWGAIAGVVDGGVQARAGEAA